jgi:hypothetical protein
MAEHYKLTSCICLRPPQGLHRVPKEWHMRDHWGPWGLVWRPAPGYSIPQLAKDKDPMQCWFPARVCHCHWTIASCTYPALPENHIRREEHRAFADGVGGPDIKILLPTGGKKVVSEGLRHAWAVGHVDSSQTPEDEHWDILGELAPPPSEERADNLRADAVGGPATFKETPYETE